ncbi:MAG: phosphoribosyltransferase [Candidatus Scalindua sp.]
MGRLIEERPLRDKLFVFKDRKEAGMLLSKGLSKYKNTGNIVLAIPSGGVSVAVEIARALMLSLDVVLVRKIQIPFNPEAGFGAVEPDGTVLFNEELLQRLDLSEKEIEKQIYKTKDIIKRRDEIFRKGQDFPSIKNRTVIIVDDGLATGYTMLAAIDFVRRQEPQKIVVAVPTGSKETVDTILTHVEELLCLNVRGRYTFAVAEAYENWYDLEDKEVISLLKNFTE